jgi:hypothetical protein
VAEVTNDPTGRVSWCQGCGLRIEEARLMKGLRQRALDEHGRVVTAESPGALVWRLVEQGHGSAVCGASDSGRHEPGRITQVSVRHGRSSVRKRNR